MLHPIKLAASMLAFALFVPVAAEAQEIAGKWTATYPAMIHNRGGNEEITTGSALLTIEQKGDSIFGTWLPQNTPSPGTPRSFRGTFVNGRLTFVGSPVEAVVRRGGDESTIQMITYFEGTFKDGVIDGTMYSESTDNTVQSSPQKWSARR
jgi:hypothetical protein